MKQANIIYQWTASAVLCLGNIQSPTTQRVNSKDGAELVTIPAGKVTLGDEDMKTNPRHVVQLSGFSIYKNLITVKQYRDYCKGQAIAFPEDRKPNWGWLPDHPMVNVTWDEARGYCKWVGGDLPTEAQWERAARGIDPDAHKFPWGSAFDVSRLQSSKDAVGDAGSTSKAGKFPLGASPEGVLDMAGNVWQWCRDWYDEDYWKNRPADDVDPVNSTQGKIPCRALRGGSWLYNTPMYFRSAFRNWDLPTNRFRTRGFRCVVPIRVAGKGSTGTTGF